MKFNSRGNLAMVLLLVFGGSFLAAGQVVGFEVEADNVPQPVATAGDPNEPQVSAVDPNAPREQFAGTDTAAKDPNAPAAVAQQTAATPAETPAPAPKKSAPVEQKAPKQASQDVMDMAAVIALVQQQQAQLAKQDKILADQARQLDNLREELDALRAPPITKDVEELIGTVEQDSLPIDIKVPGEEQVASTDTDKEASTEFDKTRDQKTTEAVAAAQADDPTEQDITDFPGAWRLPGTRAALAFGGYVKATGVYNWDPLEIKDRFIVGSIPVDSTITENKEAETSLTASQSRFNFDLREPTDVGVLRAFVEGDFTEDNDTFRLRHAFGQWNRMLAGKTWSAFVDTQASPEEVDFEGLNGRINVRQTQVRLSPRIGEEFQFQFSLEDPNPQIQGGEGVSRAPDLVMSGRFQPNEKLHTKVALLGRQIRAQRNVAQGSGVEKQYAWGLTVSGRYSTPRLGEKDSLLFQINVGDGIGRYVNDLSSVGNYDGIFNPDTGDLDLFDITAGYVSLQHWWGGTMRSNFTLGYVEVDNPRFVEGDAYAKTIRGSGNFLWTPTPRIDLGIEFLFGRREDEDGSNGDAKQIQAAARYRF